MSRYVTKDGYRTRLDCPACGEPCRTLRPRHRCAEYPHPWWEEDDAGTCQCGAD